MIFLADFLSEVRDKFNYYETIARGKFPNSDCKDLYQRTKKKSIHLTFPNKQTNGSLSFSDREKLKI